MVGPATASGRRNQKLWRTICIIAKKMVAVDPWLRAIAADVTSQNGMMVG